MRVIQNKLRIGIKTKNILMALKTDKYKLISKLKTTIIRINKIKVINNKMMQTNLIKN